MHEVGIMQSMLALAESQARANQATHIHELRVRVGRLSGVVTESLQYAFEVLREGTLAAEAQLVVDEVAPACWCATCGKEFAVEDWVCVCPACGQPSAELRRGRELELASMEVS